MVKIETKQAENQTMVPPYSKRALVSAILVIPVAFGINVPLNSFASFMPLWGIIMINAIAISSYMTFIIPKASKLLGFWLNSTRYDSIVRNELYKNKPKEVK